MHGCSIARARYARQAVSLVACAARSNARLLGKVTCKTQLVLLALLASCGSPSELRVEGEHGFVRCHAEDPLPDRSWRRGPLSIARTGRQLRITGAPSNFRVAVVTNDGGRLSHSQEALHGVHLVILLGGIGDDAPTAGANAAFLDSLPAPVLFVAGGSDEHRILTPIFERDRDGVIDATRLRDITVGSTRLIPIAGAPEGRYARSNEACGVGAEDLELWPSSEAGPAPVALSWAAPSPMPGLLGVDAGSPLIRGIAARAGASRAIFAWPGEATGPFRAGSIEHPLVLEARPEGLGPAP
jgi:hypothetical protein